jgi:DNA-binding NtrC family response regulator
VVRNEQAPATVVAENGPELVQQGFRLLVLSGELRGREIDVVRDPVTLGKSRANDVVFPDESVSRTHAEIRREAGRYRLFDRESTNGTFLGGSRIGDAWLRPGDVIGLGKVELRFVPREGRAELLPSESEHFGPVLGRSLAMRRLFGVLERIADKDVTVLIRGETGTGKDLIARALHDASPRRDQPYVVVDCGAVGSKAIESELFGQEADGAGRKGALELAEGGTLVLDGVAQLPLDVQAKLLRVLETRKVRRLGATDESEVDVRILASTSSDLAALIASGEFREDLYFRLAIVGCDLPPLRERREDIPLLIETFSHRLPPGMWRPPAPEAMARLIGYEWPGNVRELRNVVERSAYLSPDGGIDLIAADERRDEPRKVSFDPTLTFREQKERAVERFEDAYLHWLLERAGGNISRAAREADMDRKYLHKLLRRYGIDAKQYGK